MMIIKNPAYDIIKKIVQVILPALSSLYFGMASIWGLPDAGKVVGSIAVITTFLGVLLGISSMQYHNSDKAYDGNIVITSPAEGVKNYSLELNGDPVEIETKKSIKFKVHKNRPLVAEKDV